MSDTKFHVISRYPGKWAVHRTGALRAGKIFKDQKDAITYARGLACKAQTELIIHGRDGRIRDLESYGNDPLPPRDKK